MMMVKCSLPFVCAIVLFAESDTFGTWGNLTALGIVAVVLVYIVTKMLPQIHEHFIKQSEIFAVSMAEKSRVFAEAMTKAQSDFTGTLDKICERQHDDSVMLTTAITQLREHCAVVVGLHNKPSMND